MGHYRADFACDYCGKLYGCNCYQEQQAIKEKKESDRLLKILEKSEDRFIKELSKQLKKQLKNKTWLNLH